MQASNQRQIQSILSNLVGLLRGCTTQEKGNKTHNNVPHQFYQCGGLNELLHWFTHLNAGSPVVQSLCHTIPSYLLASQTEFQNVSFPLLLQHRDCVPNCHVFYDDDRF